MIYRRPEHARSGCLLVQEVAQQSGTPRAASTQEQPPTANQVGPTTAEAPTPSGAAHGAQPASPKPAAGGAGPSSSAAAAAAPSITEGSGAVAEGSSSSPEENTAQQGPELASHEFGMARCIFRLLTWFPFHIAHPPPPPPRAVLGCYQEIAMHCMEGPVARELLRAVPPALRVTRPRRCWSFP